MIVSYQFLFFSFFREMGSCAKSFGAKEEEKEGGTTTMKGAEMCPVPPSTQFFFHLSDYI